jgi:hypothetical protein
VKRPPSGRPFQLNTTSKPSNDIKEGATAQGDAAAPILIFVIACLILAILILRSSDAAALTPGEMALMPLWGP